MSRYNHKRILEPKDFLSRSLVAVATIAILVLCMPRGGYTTYSYKQGEPWDYSTIIAKDSFPVLKSDATLKKERDSLQRFYEPYFQVDFHVKSAQIEALREAFDKNLQGQIPKYYLKHLVDKLSSLYDEGIMSTEDYDKLIEDNTRIIWVYAQNESSSRIAKNVYTAKSAYEYMMAEEDSIHYNHDKLTHCNLNKFITTNLTYDIEKSQQQRLDIDNQLIPYMGQVQTGQKIVGQGDIIDEYTYRVLKSMEKYQKERTRSTSERLSLIGGQIVFASIMVLLLFFYFDQFRSDYLYEVRYPCLVLALYIFFPLATYFLVSHSIMSVYLIPYSVLPIFIRVFMDSRTAFLTHMITILTCAVALKHPFEFILTEGTAGLISIYVLRQLSERSDLFKAVFAVTLTALATYLCIDLLHGNFFTKEGVDRWTYIYLCLAGILSLIAYLLLIPIEKILGFTSNVTLVELSNINNTILRRLSEEAPGTFQHSLQVANLAAEVANKIGAKSQLVRTGALYHDIGKLENAAFFTENQNGTNPHDHLTFVQSAGIIIKHVEKGLKLAEKYKLPSSIKEFISTHHGTSMARYFYISYKNKYPDMPLDKDLFTYPGPNPHTQEQAILMMSDAVEAASRSLPEYTEESVSALVDRIIDTQVQEGYFAKCPITFLDIQEAKDVFKTKLKTIYHTRIQYPEEKE